jgi:hypothetical protein
LGEEELTDLRNWCHPAWENIIMPSMNSGNPVSYHDCCNAFTTRTLTEKASHTIKQPMKVFLKANGIINQDTLYSWAIKEIHERVRSNRPSYHPTLNTMHHEPGTEKPSIKTGDIEREFLKKRLDLETDELATARTRVFMLEKAVEKLKKTVEKLKKETKELKFREKESLSMSSQQSTNRCESGTFRTPVKKLKRL